MDIIIESRQITKLKFRLLGNGSVKRLDLRRCEALQFHLDNVF